MRALLVMIAVSLVLAALVAPGVEAVTGCAQTCPDDDSSGRCPDSLCCSCCIHGMPATLMSRGGVAGARVSTAIPSGRSAALAGVNPAVLHVPKATSS